MHSLRQALRLGVQLGLFPGVYSGTDERERTNGNGRTDERTGNGGRGNYQTIFGERTDERNERTNAEGDTRQLPSPAALDEKIAAGISPVDEKNPAGQGSRAAGRESRDCLLVESDRYHGDVEHEDSGDGVGCDAGTHCGMSASGSAAARSSASRHAARSSCSRYAATAALASSNVSLNSSETS
jgi:hypothetical protein